MSSKDKFIEWFWICCCAIFFALCVLKLTNTIEVPWLLIFAPLWFPAAIVIICFTVVAIAIKVLEKEDDEQ